MQTTNDMTTAEKARLMRNKRHREWAKKNPDRIKKYQETYYAKQYDKMLAEQVEDECEK